jgi:hypothetical protein
VGHDNGTREKGSENWDMGGRLWDMGGRLWDMRGRLWDMRGRLWEFGTWAGEKGSQEDAGRSTEGGAVVEPSRDVPNKSLGSPLERTPFRSIVKTASIHLTGSVGRLPEVDAPER